MKLVGLLSFSKKRRTDIDEKCGMDIDHTAGQNVFSLEYLERTSWKGRKMFQFEFMNANHSISMERRIEKNAKNCPESIILFLNQWSKKFIYEFIVCKYIILQERKWRLCLRFKYSQKKYILKFQKLDPPRLIHRIYWFEEILSILRCPNDTAHFSIQFG